MALSGERTREVLQAVLELLRDRLPDEVTVSLHSERKWIALKVKGPTPEDRVLGSDDRDFDRAKRTFELAEGQSVVLHSMGSYTGALVRGLGTWVPFVPRAQRARMAALDALETITRAIQAALRRPWPSDHAIAFSDCEGEWVTLGFTINGQRDTLGQIPTAICL